MAITSDAQCFCCFLYKSIQVFSFVQKWNCVYGHHNLCLTLHFAFLFLAVFFVASFKSLLFHGLCKKKLYYHFVLTFEIVFTQFDDNNSNKNNTNQNVNSISFTAAAACLPAFNHNTKTTNKTIYLFIYCILLLTSLTSLQ